jgi:ParB family chromosome partitioning protein
MTELTANRTLALRDGVANDPQVAFQAVLHVLCLNAFYRYAASTCLEITAKQSGFSAQAPGLADTASVKAIDCATRNGPSSCRKHRPICGTH